MAQIKYTEAGQERRLERLKSLREDKKSLSEFVDLKNDQSWAKLIRFLRKRIEFAKTEEKNAAVYFDGEEITSEVYGVRSAKARQKVLDLEFVIACLEKSEEQVAILDAEIKSVEDTFKVAKETIA